MIFSPVEIQETINMFMRYKLDVRAITMGISLRDCACESGRESRRRMREKILRYAGNLVETGRQIEAEFGVPIINKRIAVTPISLVAEPSGEVDYVEWAVELDTLAKELFTAGMETAEDTSSIYDKDGNYREDFIQDTLLSAARQALADNSQMSETELTLQLTHQNGQWVVTADQALLRIICGGITE